jgi:uncharacterized protein YjbJ (UPF0337 family)
MDSDVFRGHWQQLKGDIKMRWVRLTDDDLDSINGAIDKLEGRLQERYGWGKEQAVRELEAWARDRGVWV